jgi:hypothetical protein
MLCAAGAAQSAETLNRPLRTLTTAREAHDISLEEAARGYPVRFRGVVTFYDPYIDSRHTALFVDDSTASIFIPIPNRPILPLKAGTEVEVTGISGTGDYAPVILQGHVRVIGESHVPENAPRPTMAELLAGTKDGQWVEIEGIIHAVRLQPKDVTVDVATVGGSISAVAPREPGDDYDSLIDAKVQIRGNAVPVFNGNRQMVGARILFPSMGEVRIVQPPPPDPFAMPAIPVAQLLWFSPGGGRAAPRSYSRQRDPRLARPKVVHTGVQPRPLHGESATRSGAGRATGGCRRLSGNQRLQTNS